MHLQGPETLSAATMLGAITDTTPGLLSIDLSATRFIEPSGLVVLAVLLDEAAAESWPTSFVAPCRVEIQRYLSRMGLRESLTAVGCGDGGLPPVRKLRADNRFLELQRFDSQGPATEDLADLMIERLQEWDDGYLQETLYNALFELGLNIEEHAQRPGFVAAQCYQGAQGGRVCVAVGDYGVGIPASLAAAGHTFDTPEEAIREAVTTRLTSKPIDGGMGLRTAVDTFTRHRGQVAVVSGGVSVRFRPGDVTRVTQLGRNIQGTFLFGEFRWT